ncbi:MAG: hypothetical protein K8T90_13105 [Planctomycetes bacterium]|nr:hypothetical protein [Planctomycetota bacterium]
MSSLARTLAILTVTAAAIGAIAGMALRSMGPTSSGLPTDGGGPVALGPVATDAAPRRPHGPTPRVGGTRTPRTAPRDGGTRRIVGDDASDVVPLDPSFGVRLSSPDEATRLACALELLRLGSTSVRSVDTLATSNPAGGRLRDAIVNALTALGRIEAGEDYSLLTDEAKLGVALKYWATVVPLSVLRDERALYWARVVASDPERLAVGGIEAGEAAWHRLELGAVRHEAEQIGDDAWTKLRAENIDAFRAWVASLEAKNGADRSRVREAREALARME